MRDRVATSPVPTVDAGRTIGTPPRRSALSGRAHRTTWSAPGLLEERGSVTWFQTVTSQLADALVRAIYPSMRTGRMEILR